MLYFKFFKMNLKKITQYRLSLLISFIGQVFSGAVAILAIYFIFEKFKVVEGWTFREVSLTYSVVYFCFAFNECFFRGIDNLPRKIKTGQLDHFLIRPRSVLSQVLCCEIEFSKLGRILVALVTLIYSCCVQTFTWTFLKILVLITMLICGITLFLSLFIIAGSISIFTVEGIEVMNILTDGGRELCQYPVNIYGKFVKNVFTYIIPFACFNYLPLMYLLDKPNTTLFGNILAPILGCLFIIPAILLFKFALKKYTSTGS